MKRPAKPPPPRPARKKRQRLFPKPDPNPPPPPPKPPRRPNPIHNPTDQLRMTVKVMIAGGIKQSDVAQVLAISIPTLRKHYRREIDIGAAEVAARVITSIITMATTGKNFQAAKYYTQARLGWSEKITVEGQGDAMGFAKLVEVLEQRRKRPEG